jgi:hypothetical protein
MAMTTGDSVAAGGAESRSVHAAVPVRTTTPLAERCFSAVLTEGRRADASSASTSCDSLTGTTTSPWARRPHRSARCQKVFPARPQPTDTRVSA